MATIAADGGGFLRHHRMDRAAVLTCVVIIWTAILAGFGWDMIQKAAAGKSLQYPLIIHAHAVTYGAWLVLLAAQVWLIRTNNVAVHRKLGMAVLLLLPLMLVLGPAAAISAKSLKPHITNQSLSFFSTQLTNVIGCTVLITAGFLARRDASAHKRLMLMGTVAITEPGFARMLALPLSKLLGDGYWQYYVSTYIGTLLLMLAFGSYDLVTRRRLHPAWVAAFVWILANEFLATWLFYQPFWLSWMKLLTGR